MKKILSILLLTSVLSASDTALDAFNTGDYKSAFDILDKKAKDGNINAKYNLSLMYYNGYGVDQNISKAVKLLELAATAGHKKAIENVGRIYMQLMKFDKAANWLEKNAQNGDTDAYYLLAEIYIEQEKYKKAKYWTKKSIEAGNKEASILWKQYNLQNY